MIDFFEKMSGESVREYVVRLMRKNIINLNLKPGASINEKDIANELGLSRTPIREAFIKLAQEELLEIYPQKGTYVSLIDLNIVEEARFLRILLEKAVARLACQYITDQHIIKLKENLHMQEFYVSNKNPSKLLEADNLFHRTIFKICEKERTYSFMESINSHYNRIRMLRLSSNIDLDTVLSQHHEIFLAIKEKNPDKAEKSMELHLQSLEIERELLKKMYPNYFK